MDRLSSSARWIIPLLLLVIAGCGAAETPDTFPPSPEPSPTGPVATQSAPTPTQDQSPLETPSSTPAESPLEPPSPSPSESPLQTPEAGLPEGHVEGGTLGSIWNLSALRWAEHADRFRFVLEMAEPGTTVPFYTATLTHEEAQPFPGTRDPAWGTVRIDLIVSDLYAYDYPLGDRLPIEVEDSQLVTAVSQLPVYDDALLGFSIWLESPAGFAVHELTDPVRLAFDVLYP